MEKFAAQLQQVKDKKLIRKLSVAVGMPYRNLYESIWGTRLWRAGEKDKVAAVLGRWEAEGVIK